MRRAATLLFWLLVAANVVTVLVHPFPPTNDASSHLATAVAFQGVLLGDPALTAWYAFDATPLPYWLPTLLLQPLLALFEPLLAWRLLMVAYVVALPLSWAWLLRVATEANVDAVNMGPNADVDAVDMGPNADVDAVDIGASSRLLAPLGALAVFNWAYWLGEASFILGMPLVFASYGLYLGLEASGGRRRLALFVGFAVATYLAHVFALCALVGVVAVHIGLRWLGRGAPVNRAQWAAAAVVGGLFLAAVYLVLGSHGTGANRGEWLFTLETWRFGAVLRFPLGMAFSSVLPAALVVSVVVAVAARGPVTLDLLVPGLALCVLACLGPLGVQEPTGFEDIAQRFTLWGLLLTLGGLAVSEQRWRQAALLVAVGVYGAVVVPLDFQRHRAFQAPAQTLAALLPAGSKLLPLQARAIPEHATLDEAAHRFGNHVVTLRHGYSPHLFARAGQQPLNHRLWPDYRRLRALEVSDAEWAFYDHVLVQSDADPPPVPGLVERADRVGAAHGFTLWRVRRE